MPKSIPLPDWTGEDAFIIGGGRSLVNVDWSWFAGHNVIGCNQAFQLGHQIVKVVAFGDVKFWGKYWKDFEAFDGWVVTNYAISHPPPWLVTLQREYDGLYRAKALGWNHSTGAMAINLALRLGVQRLFLLGYDLQLHDGQKHWHGIDLDNTIPAFERFTSGFNTVKRSIPSVFPGREVFNVEAFPGASRLNVFPKLTWREMVEATEGAMVAGLKARQPVMV